MLRRGAAGQVPEDTGLRDKSGLGSLKGPTVLGTFALTLPPSLPFSFFRRGAAQGLQTLGPTSGSVH